MFDVCLQIGMAALDPHKEVVLNTRTANIGHMISLLFYACSGKWTVPTKAHFVRFVSKG
jgi:hypothetical protein